MTKARENKGQILDRLSRVMDQKMGPGPEGKFFFAPSRINLIGEHIDYNGGKVFPCAITIGTYGLARPNDLGKLRLGSINLKSFGEVAYPLPDYDNQRGWINYPIGVFRYLEDLGYGQEKKGQGLDILIYGNIPNGAGLSSSSSIELLFAVIFDHFLGGGKVDRMDMVRSGVWCENEFFGLHTGIMDQYVIGFGKKDYAMVLDTSVPSHTYVPFELKGARIVIMNTRKPRALKDSKYNERRSECEKALDILRKDRDIRHLCDLGKEDLPILEKIQDPILRKRAKYVVEENIRVKEAVQALKDQDLVKLGRILRAGNRALREEYEVTGPELDAITGAANAHPACFGARMTGAGFGGCAIAIVKEGAIKDFKARVGSAYKKETGREGEFIISEVGDGARLIEE